LVDTLGLYRSHVFEFARLQLTHTILSKRKLITLVAKKYVHGWDDPRMSTLQGYRRRGYSPEGINALCNDVGVTVHNSIIPIEKLEQFVRLDLNKTSRRIFCIFDPLKVTIINWTEGKKIVNAPNVPGDEAKGEHKIPFCSTVLIERTDFKEKKEEGYFGLTLEEPTKCVKLKYANVDIRVVEAKKHEGQITELIVEAVPNGNAQHAIHWIAIEEGVEPLKIEVRDYTHLFLSEEPVKQWGSEWLSDINPHSLTIRHGLIDNSVRDLKPLDRVQFERHGFYCTDPDSKGDKYVFNRTVSLKESTWKKKETEK